MALCTMILLIAIAASTIALEDDWLRGFKERALQKSTIFPPGKHCTFGRKETCVYNMPMHLPARTVAHYKQKVPFHIFQTWKSVQAAGADAYNAMKSFVDDNAEYEYFLFDDQEALNFMCTFHPEHVLLYQQTRLGAAKADLWRLAVILRYGGVYADVDSASKVPLREFVWRNASVVSGVGKRLDFHQWALIYTPGHHIIRRAFLTATANLQRAFLEQSGGNIGHITGPSALHYAVLKTFEEFNCNDYSSQKMYGLRTNTGKNEVLHLSQTGVCLKALGIVQIFNGDYMGDRIVFKDRGADFEKDHAVRHYSKNNSFVEMFRTDVTVVQKGPYTQVGQCRVKGDSWRPVYSHGSS